MRRSIVFTAISLLLAASLTASDAGDDAGRWTCHTIDADSPDHGPDGVTVRDLNDDGRLGLLVPFEQGGDSHIYWHPGNASVTDESNRTFIQFPYGGEDAGTGPLSNNGHVDIILNGGTVYFNPGPELTTKASEGPLMMLFKKGDRVPIVLDLDNDDRKDLLISGIIPYRCSSAEKRMAANWRHVVFRSTTQTMNAIPHYMDCDGDRDVATTEENSGWGVIWLENPCESRPDLPEKPQKSELCDHDAMVAIFDGKTLDGWHAVPQNSHSDWEVRNGSIVGTGSADRLSYLVWKNQHLTDFELHLRYRLTGQGNTGVEIRCRPDQSGKRPFEGYHADIGHVGIGPQILGAWDFHFATRKEYPCPRGSRLVIAPNGSFESSRIDPSLTRADVRKGGWNDVHIVAQRNHFQFYVNGKPASEFTDNAKLGQLNDGAIALQIHDKGMKVEFRDVQLKRLMTPPPPSED